MKKIGFKNFRKFEKFPALSLGNINLLVGSNNAGKSSFVKAALLIFNFIKTTVGDLSRNDVSGTISPEMNFDVSEPFDVHIGTFARAKRRQSSDNEPIEFNFQIEQFSITTHVNTFLVDGKLNSESSTGNINFISIIDNTNNIAYSIDYTTNRMFVEFLKGVSDDELKNMSGLSSEKEGLEKQLEVEKNFAEIIALKEKLNLLNKKINAWNSENNVEDLKLNLPLKEYLPNLSTLYLVNILKSFIAYGDTPTPNTLAKNSIEYKEDVQNKNILKSKTKLIEDGISRLENSIQSFDMEYIYAHAARQIIFFNSKDKNDYMAQTIHEFVTSKAIYDNDIIGFIQRWMTIFNIGKAYELKNHGGEAYEVFINTSEGDSNLADMGMGSIQLMILLFKLGTFIKQYRNRTYPPIILIEEPEQNIHPILQSKLSELFWQLNEQYHFRFIIETHSEYLVRHCQVLAAKQIYENNMPLEKVNETIKVYYFSQDRGPIDMLFMDNAKFQESFDEGFFDQASKESLTISRLERLHKTK